MLDSTVLDSTVSDSTVSDSTVDAPKNRTADAVVGAVLTRRRRRVNEVHPMLEVTPSWR